MSHFAFSWDYIERHYAGPLDLEPWLLRTAEARVPIIAADTPVNEGAQKLRDYGLVPLIAAGGIIVLEGDSRNNYGVDTPAYVVYRVNDGVISDGPLKSDELLAQFLLGGMQDQDFELLMELDQVEPLSADACNNLGWAFATYDDPERHNPSHALAFALRANQLSDHSDPYHLDTLAAAYAVSGDFERAVATQKLAIESLTEDDATFHARLTMYAEGKPFIEAFEVARGLTAEPLPKNLVDRVNAGDGEAMWLLAAFCIEQELSDGDCLGANGIDWIRKAAATGQSEAVEELGFALLHGGLGLQPDYQLAHTWLLRAYEAGSDLAAYNLAFMYREALGVERDEHRVTGYFRDAAERGIGEAGIEAGFRILEGLGSNPDPQLASRYFRMAADSGVRRLAINHGRSRHLLRGICCRAGGKRTRGVRSAVRGLAGFPARGRRRRRFATGFGPFRRARANAAGLVRLDGGRRQQTRGGPRSECSPSWLHGGTATHCRHVP